MFITSFNPSTRATVLFLTVMCCITAIANITTNKPALI